MAETLHQLKLVLYPITYRVSAPSQVVRRISGTHQQYHVKPTYFFVMVTLGFQPPLKQWVLIEPPLLNPKGFNHPNWGKTIVLMVVEA